MDPRTSSVAVVLLFAIPIVRESGSASANDELSRPVETVFPQIPVRPERAPGGSRVMKLVSAMPAAERETVLLDEIERGRVPEFMRSFVTVEIGGRDADGVEHKIALKVAPDYLCVGSDSDFVRTPLTPQTAQAIGYAFGCSLPTRLIVDAIYKQAEVILEPTPLGEPRGAVETFLRHNSIIEQQRARGVTRDHARRDSKKAENVGHRAGPVPGALVAGIKKDVVITNALRDRPDHVAIYGWHKLDGRPIQPLSTVHTATYLDYSHGIRLIARTILVDGQPYDLWQVLRDPKLSYLLSDEGPIAQPHY
ncbi:MAG: hypothetical protein ACP5R5_03910 [Armatimonadota bacterium]